MFQGLTEDQIEGALEALLFVSDEPINALTLSEMLEVEPGVVTDALSRMRERREAENSGIQLREVAGGWRLYTHPAYHDLIEKYVLSWDTRKLSQAALETLSVIAYNQPITRNGVVSVRGVNSDSSINSLIEKGLVREAGHENSPGQPILYATTRSFLEKFGLTSVADLPPLEDYAPDEESRKLIQERLGVTRSDAFAAEQQTISDLYDEQLSVADEDAAAVPSSLGADAGEDTATEEVGEVNMTLADVLNGDDSVLFIKEGIDFEHDELTRDLFAQLHDEGEDVEHDR